MNASNILTSTLNFNTLLEVTQIRIQLPAWYLKPGICAAAADVFSRFVLNRLMPVGLTLSVQLFAGVGLALALYALLLFLVEALTFEDFNWLTAHLRPNAQKAV